MLSKSKKYNRILIKLFNQMIKSVNLVNFWYSVMIQFAVKKVIESVI